MLHDCIQASQSLFRGCDAGRMGVEFLLQKSLEGQVVVRTHSTIQMHLAVILLLALPIHSGCQQQPHFPQESNDVAEVPTADSTAERDMMMQEFSIPMRVQTQHLPNAVRLHPKVVSGGLPEGEMAFEELKMMGITTVISVDGATPDLKSAHAAGLTYVHLPHGYNGISKQRAKELAKAVKEAAGPVYIHCHHGKHRSPAAAAVACIGIGYLAPEQGLGVLQLAGTNTHYQGLYEAAKSAERFELSLLNEMDADFPEISELPPLAEAMVEVGHAYDHLELLQQHDWKTVPEHPDLTAVHEALLLMEHYRELSRTQGDEFPDQRFADLMQHSEQTAAEFYERLSNEEAFSSLDASQSQYRERMMKTMKQQCKACHVDYRDVPLKD